MIAPSPKRAPGASAQTVAVPPPIGINRVDAASALPAGDCLSMVNMVGGEYGPRSRSGYRDWVTGLGGEVRSILPFRGSKADASEDRLFACTPTGIYNCTTSTATPGAAVLTFALADASSGRGTGHGAVTAAGHFLLYWDETNGYHVYTESTRTWAKIALGGGAGEVSGVDPNLLSYGMLWKNRVWMVERDTANAWYLAAGAIYGAATKFNFGTWFKAGGALAGLWNFTIDGGAGMDDYLVAVSTAGDVVIYQGTDPASADTFVQKGVYSLGAVPYGRRFATPHGGDLLLLSTLGLMPASRILSGAATSDLDAYATRKISPVLGQIMTERQNDVGWEIRVHPEDNTLVILTPRVSGYAYEQWAMSLTSKGWSQHTGVPMLCSESYKGQLYFGTTTGKVCINTGYQDNVGISTSVDAIDIEWSLLTAYQTLGTGQQKRLQMVKPQFMTSGTAPQYLMEARFNFDLTEPSSGTWSSTAAAGTWGVGTWGISTWGDGAGVAGEWRGLSGLGSAIALTLRGRSRSRTTLAGFMVMFDLGGAL